MHHGRQLAWMAGNHTDYIEADVARGIAFWLISSSGLGSHPTSQIEGVSRSSHRRSTDMLVRYGADANTVCLLPTVFCTSVSALASCIRISTLHLGLTQARAASSDAQWHETFV